MKKLVIIGIGVIIAVIVAMTAMSGLNTGSVTHVTSETTWFNSDHSEITGIETTEYTIKTDKNGNSIKYATGVLDTINR